MIDIEDELARIVELAPEPPDVAGVEERARQRRTRRRNTGLIAAVVVVAIAAVGAFTLLRPDGGRPAVLEPPATESVRVTLLDGSQLEISGPPSLGLTNLEPQFNGALVNSSKCAAGACPVPHSFSVARELPGDLGAEVGRYPTGDGHELVVYSTSTGVDAVVQYDHWVLVVGWFHDRADWPGFAAAFNAHESADGFLVIEPTGYWHLGPTDSPDVLLAGEASGGDAQFSFFAPWTYPSGCPAAAETTERTSQGWPVSIVNGAWWCDSDAHVRVHVGNRALFDEAIDGLRVQYTETSP
jgi:hypothetical protein